jgi:tetratricopeptide (TPR) repeat protein
MKKNQLILLFVLLLIISACTSGREKLVAEIKTLEESIRTQAIPDKTEGGKLVNKYLEFADSFPEDTLTPAVLYNAARLSQALNNPGQSLEILQRLVDNHYNSNPVADAYVLSGFIYETEYHDYEQARYWYELFLKEFPNHSMYEDVRATLNNLGKTPEEIVAEFMAGLEEQQTDE